MSISKKILYVGNLAWSLRDNDLEELFKEFGPLVAHYTEMTERGYPKSFGTFVVLDYQTGRSKGFGFVEFDGEHAEENAIKAIEALNGKTIAERPITVRYQEERPPLEKRERRTFPNQGSSFRPREQE